jgi:hypothetical protein
VAEADLYSSDTSKILREQAIVKAHLVEQGNNVKKILEMTIADEYGEHSKATRRDQPVNEDFG